jgi:hypothetical protein
MKGKEMEGREKRRCEGKSEEGECVRGKEGGEGNGQSICMIGAFP